MAPVGGLCALRSSGEANPEDCTAARACDDYLRLNFDFAGEDFLGGAGKGNVGEGVTVDAGVDSEEVAATDLDVERQRKVLHEMGEERGRNDAGAAGESLVLDAAFVSADDELSGIGDLDEVDVGAARENGAAANGAAVRDDLGLLASGTKTTA